MTTENKLERRYDIDALRVIAVILTLYIHTCTLFMFFIEPEASPVIKNSELSYELTILNLFLNIWQMPLLFLLAGVSSYYSLKFRNNDQYWDNRKKRLLIPFTFGTLFIIPPIIYFIRITEYNSFLEFYPQFFNGIFPNGNFTYNHLWFLLYLFVFSLIAFPIFLKLKTEEGQQFISKMGGFMERKMTIFLLFLPILIIEIMLRWAFPNFQNLIWDWANFLKYIYLFIIGYVIFADNRIENAFFRNKSIALSFGIIFSILYLIDISLSGIIYGFSDYGQGFYITGYLIQITLRSLGEGCLLIAILGFGKKYLSRKNMIINYLAEISLQFYIIHYTSLIFIAFFIIPLQINILLKFLIISTSAIFITILLCELMKTNNITRFMFGIKKKKEKDKEK
ncbi:MAG: acyltransferase family protein [archaeon]|nr:acyltransferase family protein [archaeon]